MHDPSLTFSSTRVLICEQLRSLAVLITLNSLSLSTMGRRSVSHFCDTYIASRQKHNLTFSPDLVIRGLILDIELGNVLKVCQYGQVKSAAHGTKIHEANSRHLWERTCASCRPRYVFLNTLFSDPGLLILQLVDAHDAGELSGTYNYHSLFLLIKDACATPTLKAPQPLWKTQKNSLISTL